MTKNAPVRTAVYTVLAVVAATALCALGIGVAVAPTPAGSGPDAHAHRVGVAPQRDDMPGRPPPRDDGSTGDRRGAAASGEADGAVPDGTTVDDDLPAVTRLDPNLRDALRRATDAAADDGVAVYVTSGWRSPQLQEQMLRDAVAQYGSRHEAARWVATPDTSRHVSGDAVDVGHTDATTWMSRHGSDYGLCRTYANEPWHFELDPDAVDDGCPTPYADPTHDPRMQQ